MVTAVVTSAPSSAVNITGFRTIRRGSSMTNDCPTAVRTSAGSNSLGGAGRVASAVMGE